MIMGTIVKNVPFSAPRASNSLVNGQTWPRFQLNPDNLSATEHKDPLV